METAVIFVSVIAEILITSWMFDGLVHWSDHLHNWEKKVSQRKNPVDENVSDDIQPEIING